MPVLNIDSRFAPYIVNGSKPFAVLKRQQRFTSPGDRLQLYSSLGSRQACKLRTAICQYVRTIIITDQAIGICSHRIDDLHFDLLKKDPNTMLSLLTDYRCQVLSARQKDLFAWMNGFRPSKSCEDTPGAAFPMMIRYYWTRQHSLPFIGDLIRWEVTR